MIKRPFFGFIKPEPIHPIPVHLSQVSMKEFLVPRRVTLFLNVAHENGNGFTIRVGDPVKTGQKLKASEGDNAYAISSVTGTIAGISEYIGYLGQTFTAISIDRAGEEQWDETFKAAGETPSLDNALEFLGCLPGVTDFSALLNPERPLKTVVVSGIDQDLMITTNQLILKTESKRLKDGMELLRKLTGADRIMIISPPDLCAEAEETGAEVKLIEPAYPNTLPKIIAKNVLGTVVPAGKRLEDLRVGFINAEAVLALANTFTDGHLPVTKVVTVIGKDLAPVHLRVRIGTHVGDILSDQGIEARHGDRLILGGPMTGHAVYSVDTPVLHDTDALMIQDNSQIVSGSDLHCVNCGECVRACPADIPINILIRLLENGLYEDAVRDYDLLCCIECGLCSYVCPARIPVFHYVMLGKFEFARMESLEKSNG